MRRVVLWGGIGLFIIICAVALSGVMLAVIDDDDTPTPDSPASAPTSTTARPTATLRLPPTVTRSTALHVTYRVTRTGPGPLSITYVNSQSGIEQSQTTAADWRQSVDVAAGTYVSVIAQNQADTGGVVCEILVNDRPWKRSESRGGFVIVTCNGLAGSD